MHPIPSQQNADQAIVNIQIDMGKVARVIDLFQTMFQNQETIIHDQQTRIDQLEHKVQFYTDELKYLANRVMFLEDEIKMFSKQDEN